MEMGQELVTTSRRPTRTTASDQAAHLRSETPAGVIQEIYAVLGHFELAVMLEAGAQWAWTRSAVILGCSRSSVQVARMRQLDAEVL